MTSRGNRCIDPADLGFGTLLNDIRDAVIVGEAVTEKIVLWTRAASLLFGYSEAEVLGKPIHILVPPRVRARHRAGLAHFSATGEGPLMKEGSIKGPAWACRPYGHDRSAPQTCGFLDHADTDPPIRSLSFLHLP